MKHQASVLHMLPLDHLRLAAATLVFLFHFNPQIDPTSFGNFITRTGAATIKNGSSGVSLFLVLSGFLFVKIIGDRRIVYHKFLLNRCLRIFPLLIVIVIMISTTSRAVWSPDDALRFVLLQFNTGDPVSGWKNGVLPLGVIWTVAVEFQFYLMFPLLLTILQKDDGSKNLLLMLLAFCVIRLTLTMFIGPKLYWNSYHTLLGRMDQFLLGMLVARWTIRLELSRVIALPLLLVGLLMIIADNLFVTKYLAFRSVAGLTFQGAAWAFVIVGYLHANKSKAVWSVFLAKLGALTYSFYLLHYLVGKTSLDYFIQLGLSSGHQLIDQFVFAYVPVLIVCAVTYAGIEKPFMALRLSYFADNTTKNKPQKAFQVD